MEPSPLHPLRGVRIPSKGQRGSCALSNANLSNANLSNANLREADLSKADLSNADLKGAYMPNGQKYEDWLKDKEDGKNE